MKLYLTLALVALLLNTGYAKNVPKNRNLKASSSEEVVVQETAADSDDLSENVVDNENTAVVNNDALSSTINLLENTNSAPVETTIVQNAPTKTLSRVSTVNVVNQPLTTRTVVTPVQVPSVQTVSVQSVPQTLNVVKTQTPVQTVSVQSVPQTVNVVKTTSVPTSKTVVVNQVPQQQVLWQQAPQQTVRYVQQQPQYVWQQPQTQQYVWQQPQEQFVTVQAQPQTQYVWQQPQQQLVTVQAPQKQVVWRQPQQQLVTVQAPQKQVVWRQQAPIQTVNVVKSLRVPNPQVVSLTPSKTVSRQTVLTGSQLVSDVVDESASRDVVVQETESNY